MPTNGSRERRTATHTASRALRAAREARARQWASESADSRAYVDPNASGSMARARSRRSRYGRHSEARNRRMRTDAVRATTVARHGPVGTWTLRAEKVDSRRMRPWPVPSIRPFPARSLSRGPVPPPSTRAPRGTFGRGIVAAAPLGTVLERYRDLLRRHDRLLERRELAPGPHQITDGLP